MGEKGKLKAGIASAAGASPPSGTTAARSRQVLRGVPPRGCKGRSSPPHKKTKQKSPPFPPGRGGRGGWGRKSKLKAGRASAAGGWGQQSKLKAGRASAAGGKPPSGTTAARSASAARVQCRGAGGKPPSPPSGYRIGSVSPQPKRKHPRRKQPEGVFVKNRSAELSLIDLDTGAHGRKRSRSCRIY